MPIVVIDYDKSYLKETINIWNNVVDEGIAFPQTECLNESNADKFFKEQTHTGIAVDTQTNTVMGLYILHPNNIGRCAHIANASFAVRSDMRGLHIGEKLICDCLAKAKNNGFLIMQFNAVVDSNVHARHLYKKLGFNEVGTIPDGFHMKDDTYQDIHIMYKNI